MSYAAKRQALVARLFEKSRKEYEQHKRTGERPKAKRTSVGKLLTNLEILERDPVPELRVLTSRQRGGAPFGDAVMNDPLGSRLVKFAIEKKLTPQYYLKSEEFLAKSRKRWAAEKESFKGFLKSVSDSRMRKSLEKASEKEWFKHFLYAVMVAEERSAAKSALIEMSVRNLGRQEYLEWARKFGLSEKRLKL